MVRQVLESILGRRGLQSGRSAGHNGRSGDYGGFYYGYTPARNPGPLPGCGPEDYGHLGLRLLRDTRGFLIVELLIVFSLLAFLVFGSLDLYLVQVKHLRAEQLLNYYLDRMRLEGYLTAADEAAMVNAFKGVGLTVTSIQGPRESVGDARVLRNNLDPAASEITLQVTASFDQKPFIMGLLINGSPPQAVQLKVGGKTYSERVNP